MVKQIVSNSYTLEDPIVSDGIRAVEQIQVENHTPGYIAGGMAVQSYVPQKLHRPTIDLDFTIFWCGGGFEGFKSLTAPLKSFLESSGYNVELNRKHASYDYHMSKEGNSFIVQHRKESHTHFEKMKRCLEREVANRREIVRGDLIYHTLSPEDLAIHKLNRVNMFARRYDIKKPLFVSVPLLSENLSNLKTELISHFDNVSPEQMAGFRLLCDIFDIKCLGDYAHLDKSYFNEVMREHAGESEIDFFNVYEDLENLQISLR